jgi:hypothetical protein
MGDRAGPVDAWETDPFDDGSSSAFLGFLFFSRVSFVASSDQKTEAHTTFTTFTTFFHPHPNILFFLLQHGVQHVLSKYTCAMCEYFATFVPYACGCEPFDRPFPSTKNKKKTLMTQPSLQVMHCILMTRVVWFC